jgi:probable rRNA maturation factor
MNILISNEQNAVNVDDRLLQLLDTVAKAVLDHEKTGVGDGDTKNIELSIALVDEDEIHALNLEYRGKDSPTDVLSFELDDDDFDYGEPSHELEFKDGSEPNRRTEARTSQAPKPNAMVRMLGDVIICPSVAEKQAVDFRQTFEQEMALLLTHGVLHLLGYDHIEDDEAEEMEATEREILKSIFPDRDTELHALDEVE